VSEAGDPTLTDEEIETRQVGSPARAALEDTGDDTGDVSDATDTGDDSGDATDTADDGGDATDATDTGDDSGDSGV
jgi:hypothetical protein